MVIVYGSYEWNRVVARLFEQSGGPDAPKILSGALRDIVAADSCIIFRYYDQGRPEILHKKLDYAGRRNELGDYLAGAYVLDPFYQHFLDSKKPGVFTLKQIAPDHFRQSDYYWSYYKFSGLGDEVNIFVPLAPGAVIALALGRRQGRRGFSRREVTLLHDLQPLLQVLCRRQWGDGGPRGGDEADNRRFITGMENFGRSLLSDKESEVLHLLLKGHSAKSTAARMGISPGTVKIHRNNIYAKLDIGSQTELFSLFIDALAHMRGDGAVDPLAAYQARPQKRS